MNNITIELNKEELENLLLDYYRKYYEDNSITISSLATEKRVGYYESRVLVAEIKLKRNLKIGNYTVAAEEKIEIEDIENILKESLDSAGYQIKSTTFNIKEECYGFYENGRISFKGIKVLLIRKVKQKIL